MESPWHTALAVGGTSTVASSVVHVIIGASLSEPHVNCTALLKQLAYMKNWFKSQLGPEIFLLPSLLNRLLTIVHLPYQVYSS